ncbi:hypothetical protein Emed_004344 [Eimeria media]
MQTDLWRRSNRIALLDCPASVFLKEAVEASGNSEKKTFIEIGNEEMVNMDQTTGHDSTLINDPRRETVDLVVMGAACVSPHGFLIESDEEVAAKLKTFLSSTRGHRRPDARMHTPAQPSSQRR